MGAVVICAECGQLNEQKSALSVHGTHRCGAQSICKILWVVWPSISVSGNAKVEVLCGKATMAAAMATQSVGPDAIEHECQVSNG